MGWLFEDHALRHEHSRSERLPFVSIVIINARGTYFLENCLKSVVRTNYPNLEIIVVDCMTSGIEDWIEKHYPEVKIIHFNTDIGASAQHNLGFKLARGKYLAFLDNDTEVDPSWLVELVGVMETDQMIGAAQPKILLLEDTRRFDCAGGFPSFLGQFSRRGYLEEDKGQYDIVDEIFFSKGAAMIIRGEVVKKVGLFDSSFFIGHDELDFCWRLWLGGYKVVFVPRSRVFHQGEGTKSHKSPSRVYHDTKNYFSLIVKNYGYKKLLLCSPLLFLLPAYKILRSKGNPKTITAVIDAVLWALGNLKFILTKRIEVQKWIRTLSDTEIEKRFCARDRIG